MTQDGVLGRATTQVHSDARTVAILEPKLNRVG
jgi:hypothetical protein